ncbi:hypothetical protein QR721_06565 [Aciduricibacillus chroicocephali]|uniref:Uncharacterized protein n=1 Tax=Aciduricibacillus chroicocephali TaxID=3054939 RepID=A0ABY9KYH5_9BACI|nr:hypothetical protein QR721_06565 [Bacillaceae bacterium 44XB]
MQIDKSNSSDHNNGFDKWDGIIASALVISLVIGLIAVVIAIYGMAG